MLTKTAVCKKLSVSTDKAWSALAGIGRLEIWFPSISKCVVEGSGVGAYRRMTLEGGDEIIDRIINFQPTIRRIRYDRIKSPFPVSSYIGTVEVFESFDGLAVVVWTVDFEATPELSEAVSARLTIGIGAGVDGLSTDLQNST